MNVENQSNKKQRMFANPFSFKGRIGRNSVLASS